MREEYELEVLEKYDIEVKSTRRIRGAFFCIGSELKSGRVGDFGDCLQSRSVPFGAAAHGERGGRCTNKGENIWICDNKVRCCSKRQNCQSGAPFFYMTL